MFSSFRAACAVMLLSFLSVLGCAPAQAKTVYVTALPIGTEYQYYSATVAPFNGTSPYQLTITSGALPKGLTFAGSTGRITGTPTQVGTFTFTIHAADAPHADSGNTTFYMEVNASAVSVALSPSTATLLSAVTQQFAATVSNASNTAVTWTASAGSISSAGLFTAPAVLASTSVTVTATSAADTTKSASATVTVKPLVVVSISPATASILSGGGQQFTATVTGASNTAVTWAASGGTISAAGLLTAPAVTSPLPITVTATSVADPTKVASASVTVNPAVNIALSPTDVTLATGVTQQFNAAVTGTANMGITWTASAGSITPAGLFTPPSVTSPLMITVTATSVANPNESATASVCTAPPTQ